MQDWLYRNFVCLVSFGGEHEPRPVCLIFLFLLGRGSKAEWVFVLVVIFVFGIGSAARLLLVLHVVINGVKRQY
ncbi:hypothetical protein CDL12_06160 [Handroanthus impetiginosus]|uniref:Uncharacterized protein n=1 Tax=Handroanthus impetiginosus TaxID=429701 RepID=A0A2G9HUF3_9LAMI|nr:hypothetical protein CDL12_06160 [Handroanthus impetiginosus]